MRFAGALLMILALPALGAPKAELWERWAAHGQSKVAIDHAAWSAWLDRHVRPSADGINRVAYGKVGKADRAALDDYVRKLQQVRISTFPRAEQRAYWINLYNATTVQVVLAHYPVASILDIKLSPGWFTKGPWQRKLLEVEGQKVSLDDIEHRILRPIWKDPRTHYAVNCASVGCPNLQPRAYTAGAMERLLDAGARAYVNHPRGARLDSGRLTVSSIYEWFQADFGGDDAGVIQHLRQYAEPALAQRLGGVRRVAADAYDWTLNDIR